MCYLRTEIVSILRSTATLLTDDPSCSLLCYKPHKIDHEANANGQGVQGTATVAKVDRPGTTQRVAKPKFAGFENDADLRLLLQRYPALATELQGIYALTLDPGPEESRRWNKMSLPLLDHPSRSHRGRGRGRAMRGRGGSRGDHHSWQQESPEGREHGQWTKDKGDREALFVMKTVQNDIEDTTLSEGLQEFVELIGLRFGDQNAA